MAGQPTSQRLDKWLWHARVVKTRSLAQKLISGGKVRVDRQKVTSSSQQVKSGQVLTITLARQVKILEVAGFAEKRGSYSIAVDLYNDLSPPIEASEKAGNIDGKRSAEITSLGRPSKRERKKAIDLKQNVT